ncbi:MAG: hypothetical protein QM581_16220 [Pseudomonas sp.]
MHRKKCNRREKLHSPQLSISQEVLVRFTEGDADQPVVVGALFNGRGEGGISPTPGGAAAPTSDAQALYAQAHDGAPSAQANLAAGLGGGHAPAWHAALY